MRMCQIAEMNGELIYVQGSDIEESSSNAKTWKMHIPFTPLCNVHFIIDYVLQFTMEYIMCVYIFEQRIWRTQDFTMLPTKSRLL